MWGIAHAQGIRLPTKDYWAFRDLITVGRRRRGFAAYLELFHWTELIQSSPTAVGSSIFFTADAGGFGTELWRYVP